MNGQNPHIHLHSYYYYHNHFTAPWTLSGTTRVSQYQRGKTRKVQEAPSCCRGGGRPYSPMNLILTLSPSQVGLLFGRPYYRSSLWYSMSSVCLSVCNVLYCGKTVRPSQNVSEGVNRKPGSKSSFFGSPHISTSGFAATATKMAILPYFCSYSPGIGTRW